MPSAQVSDIYNYQPVDSTLAAAGQPTEAQLGALARERFEVVVNLALHDDPRYSLPDEPGLVRSLGVAYVHIPVQFGSPTEEGLLAFFSAMEQHRGRKLFVHCAANKRVTAFLGLHRVIKQGRPVEDAFAPMKRVWEPGRVWASFISAMPRKYHGQQGGE
jgi:protein tyrosine phosphatase (PTP) superfamily phosphohydrolase (DUF442 family)